MRYRVFELEDRIIVIPNVCETATEEILYPYDVMNTMMDELEIFRNRSKLNGFLSEEGKILRIRVVDNKIHEVDFSDFEEEFENKKHSFCFNFVRKLLIKALWFLR